MKTATDRVVEICKENTKLQSVLRSKNKRIRAQHLALKDKTDQVKVLTRLVADLDLTCRKIMDQVTDLRGSNENT